jgi:hypothetical protein
VVAGRLAFCRVGADDVSITAVGKGVRGTGSITTAGHGVDTRTIRITAVRAGARR